jgi:hypothetical protein
VAPVKEERYIVTRQNISFFHTLLFYDMLTTNYLQQLLVLLLDVCAMHNYEVPPQPATTALIVGTTYKGILQ